MNIQEIKDHFRSIGYNLITRQIKRNEKITMSQIHDFSLYISTQIFFVDCERLFNKEKETRLLFDIIINDKIKEASWVEKYVEEGMIKKLKETQKDNKNETI